jgi:hypothetical protein
MSRTGEAEDPAYRGFLQAARTPTPRSVVSPSLRPPALPRVWSRLGAPVGAAGH